MNTLHTPRPTLITETDLDLWGDEPVTLQQLAAACRLPPEHVVEHVRAEVIHASSGGDADTWRFASTTITRTRRIAHLQRVYDADSQLAALTVDLMEEVERLRRLLG